MGRSFIYSATRRSRFVRSQPIGAQARIPRVIVVTCCNYAHSVPMATPPHRRRPCTAFDACASSRAKQAMWRTRCRGSASSLRATMPRRIRPRCSARKRRSTTISISCTRLFLFNCFFLFAYYMLFFAPFLLQHLFFLSAAT